mmetsp:Transcript_8354/g.14927  ORF Transcript_8354/g.14927 Transcript_8354/m.14927 type:complete len:192 (-) Transcript_8354:1025-1600(-)
MHLLETFGHLVADRFSFSLWSQHHMVLSVVWTIVAGHECGTPRVDCSSSTPLSDHHFAHTIPVPTSKIYHSTSITAVVLRCAYIRCLSGQVLSPLFSVKARVLWLQVGSHQRIREDSLNLQSYTNPGFPLSRPATTLCPAPHSTPCSMTIQAMPPYMATSVSAMNTMRPYTKIVGLMSVEHRRSFTLTARN